jgi:cephalosporin hydroxylase
VTLDLSHTDRARSVAAFGRWQGDIWKHLDDLGRYQSIMWETRPSVVIETGTHTGDSARWFATQPGVEAVITVDVKPDSWKAAWGMPVHRLIGDSTDPDIRAGVSAVIEAFGADDTRVMVSLDSDHSAAHVAREIELYAPLVSPGCRLVIEDGVLAWLDMATQARHGILGRYEGTVLDAIEQSAALLAELGFVRDIEIESLTPVTMHPAGWWRRV